MGLTTEYEKWFDNSKKGYTAQVIKPNDDKNNKPEEVKEVERILKDLGYSVGKVDGKYDTKSEEAVKKFQKEYGLKVTGIVDEKTMKAIKKEHNESSEEEEAKEEDKRIVDIVPPVPKPPILPIPSTINIGMGGRINGTLRIGDSGNDVKDLETKLAYLNYDVGDKGDKLYDANTRIAVIKFKENNGFKESTGLADKDTIDKINEVYNNALSAKITLGWDNLGQGFCNDEKKVYKLEERLNALGYLPGEIDSRYTSTTKGAVLKFQKEEMHMANPNGIVDKATMDKINEIYIEKKGTGKQILTPSQQIIDLKKDYEGFSLTLYDAKVGIGKPPTSDSDWTIGWGHKVYANSAEFKEFQNGITKKKAQELFDKDLDTMLITTLVPMLENNNIYLKQGQFDAMLDFTYQFGEYSWSEKDKDAHTTMRDFIKNGDYSEVATKKAFSVYMGKSAAQGTIARMNDRYEIFIGLEKNKYIREYNYSQLK